MGKCMVLDRDIVVVLREENMPTVGLNKIEMEFVVLWQMNKEKIKENIETIITNVMQVLIFFPLTSLFMYH